MNLQYWRDLQKISRRVAHEFLELQEFPIKIHHVKGKSNGRADALSRRPDYDQGEHNNTNITVLPDRLFIRSLIEIRAEHDDQDEQILTKWVDAHELKKVDEVWYKNSRRVITNLGAGTQAVIAAHHDAPVHRHPGIARTIQLVERDSWWPGLRREVTDYVKGCAECQRHKTNNRPTKAPLEPIWAKPEAMPFETVAVDFITKLPVSQGYDSILTDTDHDCSKATIFIPCVEEISGEETAALYAKHMFARYGLPIKIISNCDLRFALKFTRELCKLLGIQQNISTAYHPHTDRQSERSNQWLEQYLRFWANERQDNWAQYLPLAEFAHNIWPNESTCESPFHILMGYHPRADYSGMQSTIPQVMTRLEQYNKARRKAQELMQRAQQSWVRHRDTPKYKVGDQVWLEGRHLRTNQPTAKLAPKCHGLFKVVQVMSPVNYRLELPTQWSIHNVFHTDLLTPYRETPTHCANYQCPPPDLVDGVEEYEVERVLDSHRYGHGRKLQYLIAWKGYPDSDNQWVNWDDAEGAQEAIREFKCSNPDRETHIKASIDSSCSLPPARISSMTTSPSTSHWNFDTKENRDAWAAANAVNHTAPGHVCYDCNNNVDDPSCSAIIDNDSSSTSDPGDNTVGCTTTYRDVEEAEAYLPCNEPAQLSIDSTGGPPNADDPLLEDGCRGLAPGPASLGSFDLGHPAHLLPPASGTPYPTIITLGSKHGGSEYSDADIQCGKCEAPIDYCHCDLPMLPPRNAPSPDDDIQLLTPVPHTNADKGKRPIKGYVVNRLTEDGEETEVLATNEEEAPPLEWVEVCDGRGVGAEANNGGGVQRHRRWTDASRTAQRATHRPLSPTPPGFNLNQGHHYVPFRVPTTNGQGVTNAKYVRVRMGVNPTVDGCMYRGGVVHSGEVHAVAEHDCGDTPDYTHKQLRHFHSNYSHHHEVDDALERIGDKSLIAEVSHFHRTMDTMERLNKEIREREEEMYSSGNDNRKCVRRLEWAHALIRVFEEEEIANGLWVITPWVVECCHEECGRSG
jgi:hypothetical protein